ncbi:MAG TPA: hypothetical protein VK358_04130, partial [Longimicrobium sp.]|nr:hypothetical protein [Longimicrobium sp.]
MNLYGRVLRYLRPHSGLLGVAVFAMTMHAALDAFSLTLLAPFLKVLFSGGGAADAGALFGGGVPGRVVEWVIGLALGDGTRTQMQALYGVVGVIFVALLLKNAALYLQTYTSIVVEGLVTRDLR